MSVEIQIIKIKNKRFLLIYESVLNKSQISNEKYIKYKSIDKRQINGIIDIGTGITHKLTDILNHFGIEVPNTMGDESERLDNKAYIGLLEKYGWKPHINLYKYIQMNRIIN